MPSANDTYIPLDKRPRTGPYRVVASDMYEPPFDTGSWWEGDFQTLEEAKAMINQRTKEIKEGWLEMRVLDKKDNLVYKKGFNGDEWFEEGNKGE